MILDQYIWDTKSDELLVSFKNATFPVEKKWHDCFNGKLSDTTQSLTHAYKWRINRFSTRCANEVEGYPRIHDKPTEFEGSSQYTFHVCLDPKGVKAEYKGNVSLFLYFDSFPENEVVVNCKFYVENANGDKCNRYGMFFWFIMWTIFF